MELEEVREEALMGAPELDEENLVGVDVAAVEIFFVENLRDLEVPKFRDDDREMAQLQMLWLGKFGLSPMKSEIMHSPIKRQTRKAKQPDIVDD
jgi:hypothetical protein